MNDIFKSYERGLQCLLEQLGKNHPLYYEALVLRDRLLENIKFTRLYGETKQRTADRAEIVYSLNQLLIPVAQLSFIDWCELSNSSSASKSYLEKGKLNIVADNLQGKSSVNSNNKSPQEILVTHRKKLIVLEMRLDKQGLDKFTERSIKRIEATLRGIKMGIRNTQDEIVKKQIKSKEDVLANLRKACYHLYLSLDTLAEEKKRTEEFYNNLYACRECLAKALDCW